MSQKVRSRHGEIVAGAGLVLASELSLPAVLQKIVEMACEVSAARYGALGVLGRDGRIQEFVTHGASDEVRRSIGRLPEGKGLLGALIDDARPLRLERISDDPRSAGFPPGHPGMTTFLGVPVAVRGTVFGNLYLTEKLDGAAFTEEDERAVVTLAGQAGVAIENARLYKEAEFGRKRMEALHEVTSAILGGRDIDEVLSMITARARELGGADVAMMMTPSAAGSVAVRFADGHRAAELLGMSCPADAPVLGEIAATARATVVSDAARELHPDQPLVRVGEFGPAMHVPLVAGDRAFGTLALANRGGEAAFTDEDRALLEAFAAQAAVALEYARINERLRRLDVVEERERIAKDLHDDIIQSLFAEGMSLQAAASMEGDPEGLRDRVAKSVDNIDRVIRDLRNYVFGLRPGAYADRHLDVALRDLAQGFVAGGGVEIEVAAEEEAVSRLAGRSPDVLHIVREALSNAVRHSGCSRIRVRLDIEGSHAVLEVEDDGAGFTPGEAAGRGQGLSSMRERAERMSGTLAIDRPEGGGARVRVTIPVQGRR